MSAGLAYALDVGVCFLKLSGELRHDSAGPLEALIDRHFGEQADCVAAVIDLNDCQFMDSTVIGLLAGVARALMQRGLPAPTVFSTQEEINQLLRSLCLDEVFTLVEQPTSKRLDLSNAALIELGDPARHCSVQAILRAHEALLDLSESNRLSFQPVVDLFRAELKSS